MADIEEFHKQAAMFGLKKVFEKETFYVCDWKNALSLVGCQVSSKDEKAMNLLHCCKWADIPLELRQMAFAKTLEILNDKPSFNTELFSAALDGRNPGFAGRLLN